MNPYGAPPGGARPPPGAPTAPGYYGGPPPQMGVPGGLPPPGHAPAITPSSFPQAAPQTHAAPAAPIPTLLPPPRPQPRPLGPPPALQPPTRPATAAAPAVAATPSTAAPATASPTPVVAAAPTPALRPAEPLKKLMVSVTFIAPTVDNDFLEKLFAVFGTVKSMKRLKDPQTQAYKTFAFVEFESPESVKVALRVLPNQTIDGQDIQVKPTNPTKQYIEWWEANGRNAASAEAKEDGEAGVDEDAAEMEATEAVVDLVAQRGGQGNSKPMPRRAPTASRSDKGGSKANETDSLINSIAHEKTRSDERHARLEREFDIDRARKERQSEAERRRERKEIDDLMRQIRQAESDASRDRSRRCSRLADMRERRQRELKLDNDPNRRDDEDDGDRWGMAAKQERLREVEADEADRMRELEEEAKRRGAANAAAASSHGEAAPAAGAANGNSGGARGIVDMNDSIMKAMMEQVAGDEGAGGEAAQDAAGASLTMQPGGNDSGRADVGGWSSIGESGGNVVSGGLRLGGPAVDPTKASATKKAFFGDSLDENKPRPGAWVMEQRARAAAEADAAAAAAPTAVAQPNPADESEAQRAAFETDRSKLMQQIPTSLAGASDWQLRLDMLRLDSLNHYQHLQKRIAKYVHEVLPQDEEAIANEVLSQVKQGQGARAVAAFCEFLGSDAQQFTLKVWRLLIAESELAVLRGKHGLS